MSNAVAELDLVVREASVPKAKVSAA